MHADNLLLVVFTADPRTLLTAYSQVTVPLGPLRLNLPRLLAFGGAVVVTAFLALFLKSTDLGRALRAAAEERDGAALVGIPVSRVYAVAFGLGSACVAADRDIESSRVLSVSKTLMSAPAMNVVPAPISTIASAAGSADARATALSMPSQTAGLSALTGGLSIVMTATPSLIS